MKMKGVLPFPIRSQLLLHDKLDKDKREILFIFLK